MRWLHNKSVKQAVHFDLLLGDVTLHVPGDFDDIKSAIDSLASTYIPSNATVTIQLAAGYYTPTATTVINHPQASQIHITGAEPQQMTITSGGVMTANSPPSYTLTVDVDNASNINVGDVVNIYGVSPYEVNGCLDVIAKTGNTISLSVLCWQPGLGTGSLNLQGTTITKYPTQLVVPAGYADGSVFRLEGVNGIGLLKNLAIKGRGRVGAGIHVVGSGFARLENIDLLHFEAGINSLGGMLYYPSRVASCGCDYGLIATNNPSINFSGPCVFSGNARVGVRVFNGYLGSIDTHATFYACGNGDAGIDITSLCSISFSNNTVQIWRNNIGVNATARSVAVITAGSIAGNTTFDVMATTGGFISVGTNTSSGYPPKGTMSADSSYANWT